MSKISINIQDKKGYLFAYFTGEENNGEQLYFSVSEDGLHWKDLNKGKPVLVSRTGEQGVRDPFLIRDEKRNKFYIIATDLRIESGKGWTEAQENGSKSLIVWESSDLIHWSPERKCQVGVHNAGCVWAPEAIYDEDKEAFLVFWASKVKEPSKETGKHCIYASYTKDFREFTTAFKYLEKEKDIIDTTIIFNQGIYYRFTKDETAARILLEYGTSLTGHFHKIDSEVLKKMVGVEGPECYLLPDEKTWCLVVDQFATGKGYIPLLSQDLREGNFRILDENEYDLGKNKKRHGSILKLVNEEYKSLWNWYENTSL